MKHILIAFLFVVLCTSLAYSQLRTIFGANVFGPEVNFPMTVELLCDGSGSVLNCPQYFSPDWSDLFGERFYGITNRVSPPLCVTSTDGGTNWGLCPSNPFVGAMIGNGAFLTVTTSGYLIAAGGQGANTCVIKRSTNGGVSWDTVYTSASHICYAFLGAPFPSPLACASDDTYCTILTDIASLNTISINSVDEGATWVEGIVFSYASTDARMWVTLTADGSQGIGTKGINSIAGRPFAIKGGDEFVASGGYATATNKNCRPLIRNETGLRAICLENGGGPTYTYVNVDSLFAPFDISSSTIPGIGAGVTTLGPMVQMFNETIGYMIMPNSGAPTNLRIYMTGDDWASLIHTQTITPTSAPIPFCCTGNFLRWGNKFYFSSGAPGSQAFLGVIR